jgi:hypothetical protein
VKPSGREPNAEKSDAAFKPANALIPHKPIKGYKSCFDLSIGAGHQVGTPENCPGWYGGKSDAGMRQKCVAGAAAVPAFELFRMRFCRSLSAALSPV